ncbi:MAG: 50S ribosomal protein L10 [Spirochaetales bacterium]|nr:50S ribosomal protein L10 [Spirochaetales bacterium]
MALRAKKTQPAKVEAIEAVGAKIAASSDFIFTDYRGLTVQQITALRGQLREKNAEYHIVKNNFARIAFERSELPDVSSMLVGPTAVAFATVDSNEVAKIILDFGKEASVQLKGGIVDKAFYGKEQVEAFSRLPGKSQLLSMLMSAMNAPLQNFVYALNGVPTKLVRTLQAVADQKAG